MSWRACTKVELIHISRPGLTRLLPQAAMYLRDEGHLNDPDNVATLDRSFTVSRTRTLSNGLACQPASFG